MHTHLHESMRGQDGRVRLQANSGPKGPPSAPPTIPPIIINPFNRHTPQPAIDPRHSPPGPPVRRPRLPNIRI